MEPDSRRFVEDASRGDGTAVESLLARYLPDLRRFVDRRADREILLRESGADIVQSVCRELFASLRDERFDYRGDKEFKQWLYAAALVKLENRLRHWRAEKREAAREQRLEGESASTPPDVSLSTTPSANAMRREDVERMRATMAKLPEHYREIVELAHVQGLTHAEISSRLGISVTNSRVLLARALARLSTLGARPRER